MQRTLANFEGIEIIGRPRYIRRIRQALALLKRRAPRNFATTRKYIGRIQDSHPSGMHPWLDPPTFCFSESSAFFSLTWCASCIVHDAHHSKLFLDNRRNGKNPTRSVYSGKKVELECIRRQIVVSRRIGAPREEIDHLLSLDGNHFKTKVQWW